MSPPLSYPPAPTSDVVDDYHGTKVADPYRPLEDTDAPETAAWIAAQNGLSEAWLGEVGARDEIRERLTELWDHPRVGVPFRRGGRWFQLRNSGLQDQDVLYVMDAPSDDGRVLVDPNSLSDDGTVALMDTSVTDDGRLLAYATSAAGSDWLTWRVREVDTGTEHDDVVEWSKFAGAAWLPDGGGFVYGAYDPPGEGEAHEAANRGHKLLLHRLGSTQADDELVLADPANPQRVFSPEMTDDGRYLVVHVAEGTDRRNRVAYADLAAPQLEIRSLLDDFDAAYHFAGNDGATFYFVTDLDATRGRVVAIDVTQPAREGWREVVAEGADTLEHARLMGDRLVVVALADASHRLRRYRLDGALDGEIALPGIGSVEGISGRAGEPDVHFGFTSFTRPVQVHHHDLGTGETRLVRAPDAGVDLDAFVTTQEFVASPDGTRVPVFLTRRREVSPSGAVPTLLWGYGGFNISVTPMFRAEWQVWIERGGLLAIPNLRGGGEYGSDWHEAGREDRKQNVFDDCLAVTEWLTRSGWTRPDRLALVGRSNGGLLAGACLTQRPEAFGAVVPEVGVLDMLRFHRFTIGWAWAADYGSADDPEAFRWLHAYSPLHRIQAGRAYPPTLVTTGDHDDRVVPGHSLKFTAALQAAQAGEAPVLIRVQTDAGHGLGKPTSVLIAERADVLAFLHRALDVDERAA
ncbi:MAG: S9 family peptidase [Euzebyales bacterium]|nr:S9 family peptidase [Euzebyales bacterium]